MALRPFFERRARIGFVATMGALHEGHLSLVCRAGQECEAVVVSIFVNPTQFNNPDDLKSYPRDTEADLLKLSDLDVDIVFTPSVAEMYPEADTRVFSLGHLDRVMEGLHRPGHFNGVAQIVSKFFQLIRPNRAYFGYKDYQQYLIIRKLVEDLDLDVEVVGCDIYREPDGLAMSSRNALLSERARRAAPRIYKALQAAAEPIRNSDFEGAKKTVREMLGSDGVIQLEYFELALADTLEPVKTYAKGQTMGFIAVSADGIRLIDNMLY